MIDRYAGFTCLKFDRPAERVLRITLDRPESMNSLNWEAHGDLTNVWKIVDEDPDVNVAIIRGAGAAFSAGGDFSMIELHTYYPGDKYATVDDREPSGAGQ